MSTVNSGDIVAVLDLLMQVMQEELTEGRIIRLGDFGSFSLTLSAEGQQKPEDVTANTVKGAKLQFRSGKDLKNTLSTLDFEKAYNPALQLFCIIASTDAEEFPKSSASVSPYSKCVQLYHISSSKNSITLKI